MAADPEALAQLSRLLGETLEAGISRSDAVVAIERRFDRLVDGLVVEAAASDDVFDRDSAFEFVDARLKDLSLFLSEDQSSRLRDALRGKIEAW
jgi:hypothetical protein